MAGLWRQMILVQREAKVPANFRLGPIEPLVRRPGGAMLMPRIESAAGRLLNLINCNRMVHRPTYNVLIGQAARRKLGLPDIEPLGLPAAPAAEAPAAEAGH
jgi:hypothetical protein